MPDLLAPITSATNQRRRTPTLGCLGYVLGVRKGVGGVAEVAERQNLAFPKGDIGIAHTRWAMPGGVLRENATRI